MKDSNLRVILFGPWIFIAIIPVVYFLAWAPIEWWYARALVVTASVQIGIEIYIHLRRQNDK